MARRSLTLASVMAGVALLAACEDDSLSELHPGIALCPAADAPEADCDVTLDLKERPITLSAPVQVYVRNTGRAPLSVLGATVEGPFALGAGPEVVNVGGAEPIELLLTPTVLGPGRGALEVASDDEERPRARIELTFEGIEKPASEIELCDVDGDASCGPDIVVDFGTLRRGEERTRAVLVNNIGVVPLAISEIQLVGETSLAGEMTLSSSIEPGSVEPGGYVPVLVTYRPGDDVADEVSLVFTSDAAQNPQARARVLGTSRSDAPPVARAVEGESGETSAVVIVGHPVLLDGAASLDPDGDPLLYRWSLSAPPGSGATLGPAGAVAVSFLPDVAGEYSAALVVEDSLGQLSPAAEVSLLARPEHALRVELTWTGGGDLDLHLVASGPAFGAGDCFFGQPQLALGDVNSDEDDAFLLSDAESAPGREEIVIGMPADGSYAVYVHAFAGVDAAPADATLSVYRDGDNVPVLVETRTLDTVCALWHVADASFPAGDVVASTAPVGVQCP